MSSSESRASRASLVVLAPVGVDVEVFDGGYALLAQGTSGLRAELPEGIYTIRWSAAGRSEERLIRIFPGRENKIEGGCFNDRPMRVALSKASERLQAIASTEGSESSNAGRARSGSEVVIIVRSGGKKLRSGVMRSIRLAGHSGKYIPSAALAPGTYPLSDSVVASFYRVEPGSHRLGYMGVDGHVVEQTIHAFPGRRTIAVLKYGTKPTAVDAKGIVRIWTNDGILPERSVFVSGQLDGGFEWLEESVRVADILLHKLAKNKGLQDDGLVRILTGPDSDPYLQAYAAAILVRSVTDPRLDEPFPHKVYPDQERHLSSLMEQLSEYRAFPDVLCLKWRYSRASGSEGRFSYANFEFPPMLEYCWRCVSSYSLEVVGSHPSRRVMAAAAEAALTSSPWLVWSARAARRVSRDYRPADVTHVDDLGKNIEQVATRVKKITHGSTMISYDGFSVAIPRAALANLSGTTVEIANAAVAAMRSRGHLLEPHVLASSVAFATGTPAEYLSSQVTRAISELEDAERTWPAEKMDAGY